MSSLMRGILLPRSFTKCSKEFLPSLFSARDVNKKSVYFIRNFVSYETYFKKNVTHKSDCKANFGQIEKTASEKFEYVDDYIYSQSFKKIVRLILQSNNDIAKTCANIVNKLYYIHQNESYCSRLVVDLEAFKKSSIFKKFCTDLHNVLPEVHPDKLLTLIHLQDLGVPVNSIFMKKVLTLILDNINFYSAMSKIYLYVLISQKPFESSKECKNIQKALNIYFKSIFEEELNSLKVTLSMAHLIKIDATPDKIKRIIARKIFDELAERKETVSEIPEYIKALFVRSEPLFSKSEVLDIMRKYVDIQTGFTKFVLTYKNLVQQNDCYYDEALCNDIAAQLTKKFFNLKKAINVMKILSSVGYLRDDLMRCTVESAVGSGISKLLPDLQLSLVIILTQSCIHERNVVRTEMWEAFKQQLQLCVNGVNEITCSSLKLCECATFLGCDTTYLFNSIFQTVGRKHYRKSGIGSDLILRMHHLAKAYFSNGYTPIPDEILQKFLCLSAERNVSPPKSLIDFIGGEDYLLKNCTTSDKHFLDYVAVFGPDNKPVNLSSFKQKRPARSRSWLYNIENIEAPSGSKLVIFQNFPEEPIKFRNASFTPGLVQTYLKSFEALNKDIVLLPRTFEKLSPERKTEYLRTQLNEILKKHI